jgi:O-antigen ligase
MSEIEMQPLPSSDKRTWVGFVLGLWLTGVFASSLFGRIEGGVSGIYEMVMLASLAWPTGYFMLSRCRFVPSGFSPGTIGGLVVFGLCCGLSSFGSRAAVESITYTLLTVLTILVVLQFNSNLDARHYEIALKSYAVLMAALVSGFAAYDYMPGSRLGGGKGILNPASFALVTMSVLIAAMAIRRAIVRVPILVAMGTVIFLTGARASAVAALFGLAVTMVSRRRIAGTRGYALLAFCVVVGAALTAYYGDVVIRGLTGFFAIDDHHRGLESGGSGRLETWNAAWNLFLSHPVLGVGFRAHETLLKINTSAHNGYLALLAEIGLIGFAAVLYFTLTGLWRIWRRTQDSSQAYSYSVLLGLAGGYFVLAIFERYFINAGNPTSLLFLLSVLGPSLSHSESVPDMHSEQAIDRDAIEAEQSDWSPVYPNTSLSEDRIRT